MSQRFSGLATFSYPRKGEVTPSRQARLPVEVEVVDIEGAKGVFIDGNPLGNAMCWLGEKDGGSFVGALERPGKTPPGVTVRVISPTVRGQTFTAEFSVRPNGEHRHLDVAVGRIEAMLIQ